MAKSKKMVQKRARKIVSKISRTNYLANRGVSKSDKVKISFINLVTFVLLSLVFYALYGFTENLFLQNFFYLLSIILGFIALAFLILWLVFLLIKSMKK